MTGKANLQTDAICALNHCTVLKAKPRKHHMFIIFGEGWVSTIELRVTIRLHKLIDHRLNSKNKNGNRKVEVKSGA